MSLEKEIRDNYKRRSASENLYTDGYYVHYVKAEIDETISEYLKKEFKGFGNLKVLEIGAGQGSNAKIFLDNGFKIENLYFNELLPERILAIRTSYPNNTIYEGNAIEIPIDDQFDIVFQSTVFTSILHEDDRKKLASRMLGLLKPGGIILWYDFIYNNPKNQDVRKVSVDDLKSLFKEASEIYYKKITLAPPIGRRVGYFYKLFNVPLLRSHILAVVK